ncbi:MAG: acyl-CoA dehydrogenase family protein [Gluconacetobacter sp.]
MDTVPVTLAPHDAPDWTALDRLMPCFAARAADYDRSGDIAVDNLADLRDAGFLGLALPKAYGGQEIGLRTMLDIVSRIARGDPSTALILSMQYLQSGAVVRSGRWPADVKAELFRSIAQDGALINALRVEPELGTPARGGLPATTVRHDGTTWRISGRKIFSTGSTALRWGVAWARTEGDAPRVGQVLVPLDQPGVRIEKSWHQMGMRATGSHTIIFEDVAIPERYLVNVNPPSAAPDDAVQLASWHAVVIGALYDGIARAARDWLVQFLHDRIPTNLGTPLATLPRFQVLIGEIDAILLTNRALIDHALAREESGEHADSDAGLVKHLVTENAIAAVGKAVAAIGNPGLSQDNPLERHYRDVLCGRIHTPQGDSALGAAGRAALT